MGLLTTHVLDTMNGCPAAGLRVALHRLDGDAPQLLRELALDADGRAGGPLLEGDAFQAGRYRLMFELATISAPAASRCPSRCSSIACRSTSASPTPARTITCRCWPAPGRIPPIAEADWRGSCIAARMDLYLLDWANLLLRWAHVIVAIAWIGSSFYFVFLDSSLVEPTDAELREKGVGGELWAVHGGGFYHPHKYLVAPRAHCPSNLHWFYWESYSTWLTGFALFTALYLFNAGTFLIDRACTRGRRARRSPRRWPSWSCSGSATTRSAACSAGQAARAGGRWSRAGGAAASWLACHLFAGRAAFLLVGAMMATSMRANVFFWIIPGQRKVVAQLRAGEPATASTASAASSAACTTPTSRCR